MWRGISLRKLVLLLIGPMIAEALSSLLAAWMVLQAKKSMGYAEWQHMIIPAVGSVGYASSAFLAGRWVTPRWAPRLMSLSILSLCALGVAAMALKTYGAFVGLSFVMGFSIGHYYTPFQINMSHVRPFHTLAWSVAFYNIAWGIGGAVGPFLGSSLRTAAWGTLAGVVLGLGLIHWALVASAVHAPPEQAQAVAESRFESTARHRRIGLTAFLAVGLVIRGLYITLWPGLGGRYNWSDEQIGLGQLLMFAPVPLAAPLWARLRNRLDRPWIMGASIASGLSGLVGMSVTSRWAAAAACGMAVGLMESCVVFHAIYYMNADPDPRSRGRSIGIFEMMAGLASILGPVTLGLLAWDDAGSWRPYAFGCAALVLTLLYVAATGTRASAPHRSQG